MAKPRILQQLDGELSSDILLTEDPTENLDAVTKSYTDNSISELIEYVNNSTSQLMPKTNGSGSGTTLTSANITLANDPTDNMQAATKQYVDNNGGTFQAIHGITTYEEIVEAYNQGKIITLYYDAHPTKIFDLTTIPTGSNTLYFKQKEYNNNGTATTYNYYQYIDSSSNWSTNNWVHIPGNVATPLYYSSETTLSSSKGYYRPIRISTSAPTSSDGSVGDIWIQYST